MAKVVTTYGNFAKAKIDHDMMGRFDLPIYNTGADIFENFVSNFKGNAIYSAGFLSKIAFQDCEFIEFKYGNTQNYLCLFYGGKIRFLAFDTNGVFGWVLDAGLAILEVTNPYTLAECHELDYTQNNDVMVVTHHNYAPRKLIRTSAVAFTFNTFVRTADPFGAGNWPACCLFYKGRLYYAATDLHGTSVWFSVAGSYDDFTVPATFTDSSSFSFSIADITQKIEWLFPGDNSLIAGSTDGIVAINGGSVNTAITAATVQANITSAEPTNGVYPIKKDGLIFYVGRTGRNIYYFKYDLISESFLSKDANIVSYDITRGGLTKIRFKKDRNDLIFTLRGDGNVCSINFKESENIIGWHERNTQGVFQDIGVIGDNLGNPQFFTLALRNGTYYIEQQAEYVEFTKRDDFFTASDDEDQAKYKDMDNEAYNRYIAEQLRSCVFLDNALTLSDLRSTTITYNPVAGTLTASGASFLIGDINKHVVYKTATGYESGRFLITGYTGPTVVTVEVLQAPKQIYDAALYVWSSWYMTFSTVSGLTQYNGTTVGVVTDGGFLDNFNVSGGTIALDAQTSSLVIGYAYTGVIKSFCLGFQYQASNTQTTLKSVVRVGIRAVASAGGRIGTSRYHLEDYQELSQNDLNYLPPLPVDGSKYIDYTDDAEEDKFYYIVQDQPLPFHITNVSIEANYATSS